VQRSMFLLQALVGGKKGVKKIKREKGMRAFSQEKSLSRFGRAVHDNWSNDSGRKRLVGAFKVTKASELEAARQFAVQHYAAPENCLIQTSVQASKYLECGRIREIGNNSCGGGQWDTKRKESLPTVYFRGNPGP